MQSAVLLLLLSANLASGLYCYYDKFMYSNNHDVYNQKEVSCYWTTSFCFSQTLNVGNHSYYRTADCDYNYNTVCYTSGCRTVGSITTCCCRWNDCNYVQSASGFALALPLFLSALSYVFLK